MKIAFLDDFHCAYAETDGVKRLKEIGEVTIFTEPLAGPEALRGYEAIVATRERTKLTADYIARLPDARIIAQTGNHAYHIDLAAAQERGLVIAKATGGFCGAAGELAFGLMMAIMRQIPATDQAMRRGEWPMPMTRVLRGKTLGIVGLGNIGKFVARIAQVFGMRVLAWGSRLTPETAAAENCEYRTLEALMAESDVVSIHATLSPQTTGMISRELLGLMKPTAYLVNTARGAIIDEAALVDVLRAGGIAGAALDVFESEPLAEDHPLRGLPNTVLTPHLGWPTDEMYDQFATAAADAIIDFVNGRDVPQFLPGH
ncbi:D-2-hydroxyacid dehydrogenase family protein [Novosphingobium pentaromativorans]|uniref:Uncharacterized protein n=1 Tax=Novosphingobium pentaromativorans US6-1 TaxID=1088721 RepID=G6EG97_9SPHN|nr:D-2-hydroxyacid dehydrogenase family protein [Novosphingobium pentaromativorans]AIT82217.1 lactate dehydrogenase [Novosphingobium pentaromativorans US6-1]EHJ59786.1 hypothetical protein NSU_3368 [Novosphingobium pentaromativorans US6-1]